MTPAQITEEQRAEVLEAIIDGINDSMDIDTGPKEWAAGVLDYILSAGWGPISAAEDRGYARGVKEAAKACHEIACDAESFGQFTRRGASLARARVRALSPSPAQKEAGNASDDA